MSPEIDLNIETDLSTFHPEATPKKRSKIWKKKSNLIGEAALFAPHFTAFSGKCFGIQKVLKKAQIKALANVLDRSAVRFIWVAKSLMAK